jgi:hypothetical protein
VLVPHGYLRWDTAIERGREILRRLHRMHMFMATRPPIEQARVPSLATLRLEFVTSLKVGNWSRAETCIDDIDHWNLEPASATLQMRIRLLETRGDLDELFRFVNLTQAWNFASPRRIAAAIVGAIDAGAIQPIEVRAGVQDAYDVFRRTWYRRLVHVIADAGREPSAVRLSAFAAASDGDWRLLRELLPLLPPPLASFLQSKLPAEVTPDDGVQSLPASGTRSPAAPTSAVPDQPSRTVPTSSDILLSATAGEGAYWRELHRAIKGASTSHTRILLGALESDVSASPDFVRGAADGLLELLTDPVIELQHEASMLRYEALAALVDCFVAAPEFPNLKYLEIYLALLNGIVQIRGDAVSDADSQLVLGLGGAVANLSADACNRCEEAFRALWHRRPIVPRLDWLAAALDTLGELHPSPQNLVDLFADGLALAGRKAVVMSPTKVAVWRRIGASLELQREHVEELLTPVAEHESADRPDILAATGLKTIAIVSLREASANSAARELAARTRARVFVVTSLVANDETRQATTADLILYVWAASTHAAYRAFDKWRDKVEYVQGTGAASILIAAERWASRRRSQPASPDTIAEN